jgi:hypothetical protein
LPKEKASPSPCAFTRALPLGKGPLLTPTLSFLSSRVVGWVCGPPMSMKMFRFSNVSPQPTTLSLLSSRAQPRDLRCARPRLASPGLSLSLCDWSPRSSPRLPCHPHFRRSVVDCPGVPWRDLQFPSTQADAQVIDSPHSTRKVRTFRPIPRPKPAMPVAHEA